jgi:hypothetical protein
MQLMQWILGEYVGVNTGEHVTLGGVVRAYADDQMQGKTTLTHTALGTPYPALVRARLLAVVAASLGIEPLIDARRVKAMAAYELSHGLSLLYDVLETCGAHRRLGHWSG